MTSENEWQHIRRLLGEAKEKSRGYAPFWDWPNRSEREVGIVLDLFESIFAKEGAQYTQLRSTGQGNDPPDCEAIGPTGQKIGIEVSEIVDRSAVERHKAGQIYHWAEWSQEKFACFLGDRVAAKDIPEKVKGGPFEEYWLLVHSDEPELSFDRVSEFLAKIPPYKTRLLTRLTVLLSYSPQLKAYPYFNVEIERAV